MDTNREPVFFFDFANSSWAVGTFDGAFLKFSFWGASYVTEVRHGILRGGKYLKRSNAATF